MSQQKLTVKKREQFGRKIKQLRKRGFLPANIFGKAIDSISIQLDYKQFANLFDKVGETGIVEIEVEGEKKILPTLISNVHLDPVTGSYLHIDFRHVDLMKVIVAAVPIEVIGESPAVKDQNGVLVLQLDEIEVEALPADLPEKITLDITILKNIGDAITVADLNLGSKVTSKTEPQSLIVSVQEQQQEEPEAEQPKEDTTEAQEQPETSSTEGEKPSES